MPPSEPIGPIAGGATMARMRARRTYTSSIMPWENLQQLTETDVRSIYRYHPTLAFLSPDEGETVPVGDLQVSIVVEDFELVAPEGTVARVGALPLWLLPALAAAHDEEGVPSGYCELSLDGAVVGQLDTTQLTIPIGAGPHTLEGRLHYADGDELAEPVTASVSFTAG